MPPAKDKYTGAELQRARDYVRDEPGFTFPFMAWELGIEQETAKALTARMFADGWIQVIEPAHRPHPAVYGWKRPKHLDDPGAPRIWVDDHAVPAADLAGHRGEQVPHVRPVGRSGKPGENRRRQQAGATIKRKRNGT